MKKKSISKACKRVLALVLTFVMVLGAVPATVFAEDTQTPEVVEFDATVLAANATANSQQVPEKSSDGGAAWAFDDEAHWWHTRWSGDAAEGESATPKPAEDNPIYIQTGFDKAWMVDHLTYLSRQDDGRKGIIKDYTVSVANLEDPEGTPTDDDFTVVASGTLSCTKDEQTIQLEAAVEATHVRLTVTSVYSGYGDDGVDQGDGHLAAQNISIFGYDVVEEEPEVDTDLEVSDRVQGIMDTMTLRQKITQMLMVDFRYWDEDLTDDVDQTGFTVMNDQVRKIVEDYDFGAIIYFAQNLVETEQSYNLTMEMQAAATKDGGIPLLISADQEGGSVYRLGTGTALPGNMALGATGDTANAYAAGQIIGSELSVLGINTDLAPVVDVNNNANNPVIGLRSYGDDPVAVGQMASASIAGMAEYNVIGCAKHFPGHGDTATDSHYGLPIVDKSLEVLKENELKPYEVAIEQGIEMIMTAHILYPQLEKDTILSNKTGEEESLPATMSDDIITGLLKGDMGFDGIVVSDAMNMAGVSANWDQVQSVVIAIQAGMDMICMPCTLYNLEDLADLDAIIEGVEDAVEDGTIPMSRIDDAVARILTVKENRGILDYDAADYSVENALATVGSDENREKERQIAANAVTVIKNTDDVLPLDIDADTNVLMLVPYTNEISQMLMGWNRAIEAGIIPYGAEVDYARFSSSTITDAIQEKLEWADIVIINSEVSSAAKMAGKSWLSAFPEAVCDYCAENGKISIISSVDKPYDVQLYDDANAIVAAYGCKGSTVDVTEALVGGATGSTAAYGPNIIAAVEVILGTFEAQGTLPVNIPVYDADTSSYTEEIAYARGYGLTYDAKEAIAVDKTALEEKVAEYKVVDPTAYTAETAQALSDALEVAKAVLADEAATQYEVEEALVELEAAYAALVAAPTEATAYDQSVLAANVLANSEMLPADKSDGGATWAFDDEEHWWHSRWGGTPQEHEVSSGLVTDNPIWIQTGFGKEWYVESLTYLSRSNGYGRINEYTVSVANLEDPAATPTDDDFTVVKTGSLENSADVQTIVLDEVTAATHVRLTVTSVYTNGGTAHVAAQNISILGYDGVAATVADKTALAEKVAECAAIDTSVYTEESAAAFADALAAAEAVLDEMLPSQEDIEAAIEALAEAQEGLTLAQIVRTVIEPEHYTTVTAGDEEKTYSDTSVEGPVELAVDGNESTFWHSDWYVGDNHDEHWVEIELDSAYMVNGLTYLPRQSGNSNGRVTAYKVLVSLDGEEWTEADAGTWASDTTQKASEFDAVKAKYVRFKVEEAESDIGIALASAAEIRVTGDEVVCAGECTPILVGDKAATCTEDGYTGDTVCSNCYKTLEKGEVIAAFGHDWSEWEVTAEPDCTTAGSQTRTCATCGEVETEDIAALGHDWSEWTVITEPTCTEKGSHTRTCATCEEVETEDIAALGHDWSEWTVLTEATHRAEGSQERTCSVCEEVETGVIAKLANPFVDVTEEQYWYEPVMWALDEAITDGTSDTTFSPENDCTRGHVVTFLWRAMGCPEPTSTENNFVDVAEGAFYYDAVLWAVEKGITDGTSDTTFSPDAPCTRAHVVTFLWRNAGNPAPETTANPFTDVAADAYYVNAVLWAVENGITDGTAADKFSPDVVCNRGQAVTFLFRGIGE